MANYLKMATVQAILTLKERGWSNRRIERELGIRRETVSRYVRRNAERSKPAKAPPGLDIAELAHNGDDSKAARAPTGSGWSKPATKAPPGSLEIDIGHQADPVEPHGGPTSRCEPFREIIKGKLEQELTAKRIHQDLIADYGFPGSYYSVRRFVRRLGKANPLPFRRMESAPGDQAQVDFGTGRPIITADGKRRRSHVFRIVLSNSRRGYSESVFRQTTEDFIGCLENAFWHFGGVPKTLIIDNLKAAVSKADWFDPELNPRLQSFCEHYGTVVLPTKPYTPRHKGKIENGIGYVQDNALTHTEHIHPNKISGIERGATWLLRKVSIIGPHTDRWARAMLANRGIRGIRVLQGMLSLMNRHPCKCIEQACEIALSHHAFRLRTIREIIQKGRSKQGQFEFIDEHPIIRPLTDYGEFVKSCLG